MEHEKSEVDTQGSWIVVSQLKLYRLCIAVWSWENKNYRLVPLSPGLQFSYPSLTVTFPGWYPGGAARVEWAPSLLLHTPWRKHGPNKRNVDHNVMFVKSLLEKQIVNKPQNELLIPGCKHRLKDGFYLNFENRILYFMVIPCRLLRRWWFVSFKQLKQAVWK